MRIYIYGDYASCKIKIIYKKPLPLIKKFLKLLPEFFGGKFELCIFLSFLIFFLDLERFSIFISSLINSL